MKRLLKWAALFLAGLAALAALLVIVGLTRPVTAEARASIEIRRPPEEVFDFLADLENLPKWSAGVKHVSRISSRPRKYRVSGGAGPSTAEFLHYDRPRHYVSRIDMPRMAFSGIWDIHVEPSPGGSRVTSSAKINLKNPVLRALAIFMDPNAAEQATLADLKKYLESAAP